MRSRDARGLRDGVVRAHAPERLRRERPEALAASQPRVEIAQIEELPAQRERIVGPAREIDLAAAVRALTTRLNPSPSRESSSV